MSNLLLYLHGFHSSPQSLKAQQMAQAVRASGRDIEFVAPQLACHPQQAWQQIEAILASHQGRRVGVVGSSLGGFLATRVVSLGQSKGVIVNPAVRPYHLLSHYLGPQTHPYTNEQYTLNDAHITELKALEVSPVRHSDKLWVLLQAGDEVLDYRLAEREYAQSKLTIEQAGDHSFQGFERYTSAILHYLFD